MIYISLLPGESVFARCLSSLKDERIRASKHLKGPAKTAFSGDKKQFIEDLKMVIRWRRAVDLLDFDYLFI